MTFFVFEFSKDLVHFQHRLNILFIRIKNLNECLHFVSHGQRHLERLFYSQLKYDTLFDLKREILLNIFSY